MLKGRTLAIYLAGSASALCLPCFAQAQSAPQGSVPAPTSAEDAVSADDGGRLDEIIVTAQKREQNLQTVPIAISAISETKIAQLGITDSRNLTGLAPSVTVLQPTTSMTAGVLSIRGIPSGAQESLSLDQANGLYVDGVYIARSGAAALDVTDIARVEVLRGPQGTLFGRNTTGGAIAFISRDPSKTFRGNLTAGIGNYGLWNTRASIDPGEFLGISSTFSYARSERHGFVDNILQPDRSRDPGARRSDSFRVALKARVGGTGSIRYVFDWSNIRGNPYNFQLLKASDGSALPPVNVNGLNVPLLQQAPVAGYLNSVTFLEPGCAALAAPTRAYRDRSCLNSDVRTSDKIWGHNLQVRNDFGGFSIKSTTGYRSWHSDNDGSDLDGLGTIRGAQFSNATLFNGLPASLLQFIPSIPAAARPIIAGSPVPTTTADLFTTSNIRRHRQFSEEVEVSGNTDNLDWVVGGFYFWEKGTEYNPQNSGFVVDTNAIFTSNFGALGPAFVAANPARYRLVVTNSLLQYQASAESTAIYSQGTYYFGGRQAPLSLTAGLRYTWDVKNILRQQNGPTPSAQPEVGKANFQRLTWNAMLRYEFTDDVSVYARAATGYRSGGFNPADTPPLVAFRPEKLKSYELGLKSELFDKHVRLNLAGYYNTYDDLAVVTTIPSGTTFNTRIVNAGRVDYLGAELEGQVVLTDNFSIDGNVGYVDVRFKKLNLFATTLPGAPSIDTADITRPTYTSSYTGNVALNAQFPVGRGAKLVGRVGYTYLSPQYFFSSVLAAPYNDVIRGDAQSLVDAQLSLEQISIGGLKAQVKAWARNLTNQHDMVRAIDFGQLGFAGGYFNEPRTYGATLGVSF